MNDSCRTVHWVWTGAVEWQDASALDFKQSVADTQLSHYRAVAMCVSVL